MRSCMHAGVHSLAAVVAFKMECDPDAFAEDPEGMSVAKVGLSARTVLSCCYCETSMCRRHWDGQPGQWLKVTVRT